MPDRDRSAFTLVELLVVIVIITILVGLLIPAVIGARERARQSQCSNNQRELGVAVRGYEAAKDHVPGYINNFGASINTSRLSWLVVVLPHLGREDLWAEWRDPSHSYNYKRGPNGTVDLGQLRCPSDSRSGRGVLSYVANCGIESRTSTIDPVSGNPVPESQAHGIFQNGMLANAAPSTTDRIPDGAQTTLLFSENLQATLWAPPLIDNVNTNHWTGLVDPTTGVPDYREAHVGMVWSPSATPDPCRGINQCRDAVVRLYDSGGMPLNPPTLDPPYDTKRVIVVARPSSYHVGGVVATYADGHQDFMDEQIDYSVFRQLMATDDTKLGL